MDGQTDRHDQHVCEIDEIQIHNLYLYQNYEKQYILNSPQCRHFGKKGFVNSMTALWVLLFRIFFYFSDLSMHIYSKLVINNHGIFDGI